MDREILLWFRRHPWLRNNPAIRTSLLSEDAIMTCQAVCLAKGSGSDLRILFGPATMHILLLVLLKAILSSFASNFRA